MEIFWKPRINPNRIFWSLSWGFTRLGIRSTTLDNLPLFFQSHLLVICSGIVLTGFLGHELANSTMHGGFLQQNTAQNILLITLMENNCPILLKLEVQNIFVMLVMDMLNGKFPFRWKWWWKGCTISSLSESDYNFPHKPLNCLWNQVDKYHLSIMFKRGAILKLYWVTYYMMWDDHSILRSSSFQEGQILCSKFHVTWDKY